MRAFVVLALVACSDSANHVDAGLADARAGDAPAPPTFGPKVDFATGPNPTFVAIADLDGDGRLDLVIANTNASTVSILLNTTTPGATLTFAARMDVTTGSSPACVAVGDINDDGKPDLVTANVGASTVSVLLNTTTGGTLTFATAVDVAVGSNPEYVAIGDLDGDGKPDIATANVGANTASVLVSTTATGATIASFAPAVDVAAGAAPVALFVGDIDGDGKLDLGIANLTGNTISFVLNTTAMAGTPTFAPKLDVSTGMGASALAFVDVDGDGKRDVIVTDEQANAVSLLLNTTPSGAMVPTIAPKIDVPTGSQPDGIAVADLDGDGKPEIATADFGAGTVSVLYEGTPPSYAAAIDFATGPNPRAVASGDLDGDHKPDLVVANGMANTVSVLLAH